MHADEFRDVPDAPLLPLLAGAFALAELYIVAPGLLIAHRTGTIAVINIGSAALNLVLNVLLVPMAGLLGACIATTASAAGALWLNIQLSQRYYPIPYPWGALSATGVVALLIGGLAVWVAGNSPMWDTTSLLVRGSVALVGFIVSFVFLVRVDLKDREMVSFLADRLWAWRRGR